MLTSSTMWAISIPVTSGILLLAVKVLLSSRKPVVGSNGYVRKDLCVQTTTQLTGMVENIDRRTDEMHESIVVSKIAIEKINGRYDVLDERIKGLSGQVATVNDNMTQLIEVIRENTIPLRKR